MKCTIIGNGESRKNYVLKDIRFPYFRMNSWLTGEIAIVLAAQLGFKDINVIGFDGGHKSLYRGDTDTNSSMLHCQVPEWRYNHVENH